MTAESPSRAVAATRTSPDDLLANFSESHGVRWFLAALLIHAVVIGGLSVGTIRDWADPEGAKARKEAALAAATAAAAPVDAAAAPGTTPTQEPPAADEAKPERAQPAATAAAGKQTPIEKATTEAAKPEEIPSAPDELGLSIEDTNPN